MFFICSKLIILASPPELPGIMIHCSETHSFNYLTEGNFSVPFAISVLLKRIISRKLLDLERRIIFYVVLIYDFAGNYVILFYIFSIQIINHILDCCLDHCRAVSYRYNTTKLICDICEGFTTKYCIKLIQSATACQIRCNSEEFFLCCIDDSAALES